MTQAIDDDETLLRYQEFWQPLARLGCAVDRGTERLFAVDVPPQADIYDVSTVLEPEQTRWHGTSGRAHRPSNPAALTIARPL